MDGDQPITRNEVISRARFWLENRNIHYHQDQFMKNQIGNFYRTDCSGFVSMALAIRDNPNTVSFPQHLTAIRAEDLKPGDVLGVLGEGTGGDNGHITLFIKWDDANHTTVTTWEHGGDPDYPHEEHHTLSDWSHPVGDGFAPYKPYKYDKIVDEAGPVPTTGVAVVKQDTAYHVFVCGPDGSAYQRYWDGGWRPPEPLGGVVTGSLAALCFPALNRVELYGIGTDGRLRQHIYDDMWLAWQIIPGGHVLGGVAAAVAADGARHLVAVNGSGTIYQRISRNGSWSDWQSLGGIAHGTPALLYQRTDRDRYDLFVTDHRGQVAQRVYLDGIWHHWVGTAPGSVLPGVTACRTADAQLHIFARGTDRGVRHAYFDGQWHPWQNFAGEVSCVPAVVADGNRIDLFALDRQAQLIQKTWRNHQWFDWRAV